MSRHQEGWIYIMHQLRGFDIILYIKGITGWVMCQSNNRDLEKLDEIKAASSELFIKLKITTL